MVEFIRFCKQFPVKRFERGELILVQGEIPTCTYVIKKGVVKEYNLTSQGEEKPISFDVENEVFPMAWSFEKAHYAQYYYEAFSNCEVYCVPRAEYKRFLKSNPDSLYQALNSLVDWFVNYQMRINALEQSKANMKIVNTLHFLCLRYGINIKNNMVEIQLPLTQQDLANFMGLTRETTGIELKKLQRKGVLTYKKQSYIVRTDKLEELLDEDYDQGRTVPASEPVNAKLKTAA
ncbi:N/A [soil metagenome]